MKNRDRCEMKGNPKGTLKQGKLVYSVFRPGQASRASASVSRRVLGAGELPRRLAFRCMCAGMVPVAPAVGAVLVCACCTGGTWCGLMCVWYLR